MNNTIDSMARDIHSVISGLSSHLGRDYLVARHANDCTVTPNKPQSEVIRVYYLPNGAVTLSAVPDNLQSQQLTNTIKEYLIANGVRIGTGNSLDDSAVVSGTFLEEPSLH